MQNLLFLAVGSAILLLTFSGGFRRGLQLGWMPVLILAPVWLRETGYFSVVLDLRSIAGWAILPALMFALVKNEPKRLLVADLLLLLLIGIICISMHLAGEMRMLTIPEILRQWLLPYLMGRWFLGQAKDLDRTVPIVVWSCILISSWGIFEAVTKTKLPMMPYIPNLESDEGFRWGLKRAVGPTEHPIFFGLMLAMMLPWIVIATYRAWRKQGPKYWLLVLAMVLAAICVTVSRGAWLAAGACVGLTMVLRWTRWRVPLLILILVGGATLWLSKDIIIPKLGSLIKSEKEMTEEELDPEYLIINGEKELYTGDRHRILQEKVYKNAAAETGWFGYGNNIQKNVPLEEELKRFSDSIDNHYLRFRIQFGLLGLWTFQALNLCVLWYLLQAAWPIHTPQSMLAASLFGSMVGLSVAMWTVWFAPDYGSVWLFCCGLAGSIRLLPETKARPAGPDRPEGRPRKFRLLEQRPVSGSAPLNWASQPERGRTARINAK